MQTTTTTSPADAVAALGLTVDAVFVPFSRSRNKAEKSPSLNWIVTLKRNGRDVITTEYSAGSAHCPSFETKPPAAWDRPVRMWQPLAAAFECEQGFAVAVRYFTWRGLAADKTAPILPDPLSVIYSLVMEAYALDAGGFENWAAEFGYDTDSRTAEKIYQACLDIALKLRGAIGETGLESLREAFQDY